MDFSWLRELLSRTVPVLLLRLSCPEDFTLPEGLLSVLEGCDLSTAFGLDSFLPETEGVLRDSTCFLSGADLSTLRGGASCLSLDGVTVSCLLGWGEDCLEGVADSSLRGVVRPVSTFLTFLSGVAVTPRPAVPSLRGLDTVPCLESCTLVFLPSVVGRDVLGVASTLVLEPWRLSPEPTAVLPGGTFPPVACR